MRKFYAALLLQALFYHTALTQPLVSYQAFLSGFTAPVEVVNAADGSNRLFIVQQDGTIRVYDPANSGLQATPFLNINSLVLHSGEQGLLSMAFHPLYETNGYFFLYYNNNDGDVTIARYKVSEANVNVANADSVKILMTIPKPYTNHNGGHLQFGQDGNLYFATGDGGSSNDPQNNAQNPLSILGKMIRINVDNFHVAPYYSVPSSNPFVGNASYDSRIWALGLRNPFRWSFDRLTGDMWIGDVGQGAKEEINYRPASSTGGENYGWRCYEGSIRNPNIAQCNPANYYPPVFDYDNPVSGAASVAGGYVYRGSEFSFFNGWYITTDVYTDSIYLLKANGTGGWLVSRQKGNVSTIVSFGEAEDGTLYAVSQATNTMYKVVASPSGALPVVLNHFSVKPAVYGNEIKWTTATERERTLFTVEYSVDGIRFQTATSLWADGNSNGATYAYMHSITAGVPLFYRLCMTESSGNKKYSPLVRIDAKESSIKVYPTVVRDGRLQISGASPVKKIQVLNSHGSTVYEQTLGSYQGFAGVQLPPLAKGLYIVCLWGSEKSEHKIFVE